MLGTVLIKYLCFILRGSNYNGYAPWYAQQSTPQQVNNGLIWVQGEAGAKSYLVAPGQSVLLLDSENNVFYIKSSDGSGMPMPLRTFDYKERTVVAKSETTEKPDYITRDEFEKVIAELRDAKQSISTVQ